MVVAPSLFKYKVMDVALSGVYSAKIDVDTPGCNSNVRTATGILNLQIFQETGTDFIPIAVGNKSEIVSMWNNIVNNVQMYEYAESGSSSTAAIISEGDLKPLKLRDIVHNWPNSKYPDVTANIAAFFTSKNVEGRSTATRL